MNKQVMEALSIAKQKKLSDYGQGRLSVIREVLAYIEDERREVYDRKYEASCRNDTYTNAALAGAVKQLNKMEGRIQRKVQALVDYEEEK